MFPLHGLPLGFWVGEGYPSFATSDHLGEKVLVSGATSVVVQSVVLGTHMEETFLIFRCSCRT